MRGGIARRLRGRMPLIIMGAAGSAGLLASALAFEHLGGLAPCELCHWQRAGHLIALIGLIGILTDRLVWPLIGAAGAAGSALAGLYHMGMEKRWWSGPEACSGGLDLSAMSGEAALAALLVAAPVRCDEVVWSLIGLSMAGWNALISVGLCAVWVAASHKKTPQHMKDG